MNQLLQIGPASLLLSVGIAVIAILLVVLNWLEQRGRDSELSPEDADHFARQRVRRAAGLAVMLLLAAGIFFGSRVPPRAGRHANPVFVETWLAVFGLIFVLLVLAIVDWRAIRLYARRHRTAILRERLALINDEHRLRFRRGDVDGTEELADPGIESGTG
jgi:drug/metabolite transporter (DMT)-like permease